jgi:RES domain-containing protein
MATRSADSRMVKAMQLLQTANTWTPITCKKSGKRGYIIPSQSGRGAYQATSEWCQCPDFQQRGIVCKHALSVALFEAAQAVAVETDAAQLARFTTEMWPDAA